jgi:protein involved in polysaccharide export with SLBB domain
MRLITLVPGLLLTIGLVLFQSAPGSAGEGDSTGDPSPTVSIEGGIVNPGTYDLKPGWGLDDLIVAAGKMTLLADTERVEVRRKGVAPQVIDLRKQFAPGNPKFELAPGDRIVIPEHQDRVAVLGVPGGGFRPLVPGQKLSDFLRLPENASLLDTTKVDVAKTTLMRKDKPALTINLKKILKNPHDKQNVQLESGDMILLRLRPEPRDEKKLRLLLHSYSYW